MPPATNARHPTADTLAAFAQGHALPDRLADLTAHLESCPECLARLDQLQADDELVAGLRAATVTQNLRGRGPARVEPPPFVPGYRLGHELGRGGMGVVYEAESLSLGRRVAIKLLRDGGRAGPDILARFRAEAMALGRLHHPNVVQVFESGLAAGVPFVVLEYVAGGTLADAAPMPPRKAAATLMAVARGVQAAHEAGIVHRDLKPANVLLDAAGEPKVSDFGLAKLTEAAVTATVSGTIAGTPAYMSPEQAAGTALPSPSMDVYSLGAILYELLAGRPPFTGDSVLGVLQQLRDKEPPALGRGVPADLATICRRCLRKEPAGRYASAAAVADDLGRFLSGRPILARPVGPRERVVKWARRHPSATALSAALLLAIVAGLAGVGAQFANTDRARREAEAERGKARLLAATQALDRGILLCESGKVDQGLPLFDQAAELAADTDPHLEFAVAANRRLWQADSRPIRVLPATGTAISGAALSPDGNTLLTAEWGNHLGERAPGRVLLWSLDDLSKPRLTVTHPGTEVRTTAWHPTGTTFISAGMDGTVRTWDAATGAEVGEPLRLVGPVACLAFAPGGGRLAVAATSVWPLPPGGGGVTAEVRVWDWPTHRPSGSPLPAPFLVRGLDWSPDGSALALAGLADTDRPEPTGAAAVLDPLTGHTRMRVATTEPLRAVAWHPDGWLATGGDDGTVRGWEADGRRRPGLFPHPMRVNAIRFADAGRVLVAACGQHHPAHMGDGPGEVQCWDLATRSKLGAAFGDWRFGACNKINDISMGPDGRRLAAASETGHAWVTELPLPPAPLAAARLPGRVHTPTFSPDGRRLAIVCSSDGGTAEARVLDADTLAPRGRLPLPHVNYASQFHPSDGPVLLYPDQHHPAAVQVWDGTAERPLPDGLRRPADWAGWSPDGAELWTHHPDGHLCRWDAGTLEPAGPPLPTGRLMNEFASDLDPFVAGLADGRLALWFPRDGRRVELAAPAAELGRGSIVTCSYHAGAVLVTACWQPGDTTVVRSWDTATGRLLAGPVTRPGWSSPSRFGDGRVMVWQDDAATRTARLADPRTLTAVGEPVPFGKHSAVHPDGRSFATVSGSPDERSRLRSFAGRTLGPPVPHPERVYRVAFDPTGRRLFTAGADMTLRLWAVP